jgi:ribonuclease HII
MNELTPLLRAVLNPEEILCRRGFTRVAGVDEAGRGALAGPVVAAAVILPCGRSHPEITDSKKLSPSRRARLFDWIAGNAVAYSWASVEPAEIDRINILQASLAAMRLALNGLGVAADYAIIDGPFPVPTPLPQTPIPRGDMRSQLIAAASIVAKVTRDALMRDYHDHYPRYLFARNKGYGTREHLSALAAFGCCPIHRKTFKGVVRLPEA